MYISSQLACPSLRHDITKIQIELCYYHSPSPKECVYQGVYPTLTTAVYIVITEVRHAMPQFIGSFRFEKPEF